MNQLTNNRIVLCGEVAEEPLYSHEVFGESFFSFVLSVNRLSGQKDRLPVTISERLLGDRAIELESRLVVDGQLRSYNILAENHSRLQLQTFAREIYSAEEGQEDENAIVLEGYICKPPVYRVTPFSREIADVLIAVNRAYGKSDYIPCICWGRNARYCQQLQVGEHMCVEGRLQSREYQKKITEDNIVNRVAYEVSVSKLAVQKGEEI